jgi:hypothetical protein
VTTNQPITFGVHTSYITILIISPSEKTSLALVTDLFTIGNFWCYMSISCLIFLNLRIPTWLDKLSQTLLDNLFGYKLKQYLTSNRNASIPSVLWICKASPMYIIINFCSWNAASNNNLCSVIYCVPYVQQLNSITMEYVLISVWIQCKWGTQWCESGADPVVLLTDALNLALVGGSGYFEI